MRRITFTPGSLEQAIERTKTETRRLDTNTRPYKVGELLAVLPFYDSDTPGLSSMLWTSSRYMPAKYARHFIRVTKTWVEQLQKITPDGARREGFADAVWIKEEVQTMPTNIWRFSQIWNSVHRKRGTRWEDNPRVRVYRFEYVSKRDAMLEAKEEDVDDKRDA